MTYAFFAQSPRYVEELLADEITALGAESVKPALQGVYFRGPIETAYRVCLWSRLANRIMYPLANFPAETPEVLYEETRKIEWFDHMNLTGTFAVDASLSSSKITHTDYTALKVKDAIVDLFRDRQGSRPDVDPKRPDLRVHVRIFKDRATISLDLSGESLHRRGYRVTPGRATLKENIAAAMLVRAGWKDIARDGGSFLDPMCGTGTLAIEAALIASDTAPGIYRERWGFMGWKGFQPAVWRNLVKEAQERRAAGSRRFPVILASDRDALAVRATEQNVRAASLEGKVRLEQKDFRSSVPPTGSRPGLIAVNPPYGERLGDVENLRPTYRELGKLFIEHFSGWKACVLSGNEELSREIGLKVSRVNTLDNGPIRCVLTHYELGRGAHTSERSERLIKADRPDKYDEEQRDERPRNPEKRRDERTETKKAVPAPARKQEAPATTNRKPEIPGKDSEEPTPGKRRVTVKAVKKPDEGAQALPEPLSEDEDTASGLVMLRNRLNKSRKHLGKWARKNAISCYRIYDADLPEYNAAIDIFEDTWVHLQEYAAPDEIPEAKADAHLSELLSVIPGQLGVAPENIFVKQRKRQKGMDQYEKISEAGSFHEVQENGLKFLVNFSDYIDTGLFLDHRTTRSMIRDLSPGVRFLNLFAYTCTGTVYAAAGGATFTTSVDNSNTYLEWGERNMKLNGFSGSMHRYVREDCLKWLKTEKGRYDLIFLDPPTFSNSRRMEGTFDIQRDHVELITDAAKLLTNEGVLIFSTNFRKFKLDTHALRHLDVQDITKETIPQDFIRNQKIHFCALVRHK